MLFEELDVRKTYQFLRHKKQSEIRLIDPTKKHAPCNIFVSTEEEFVDACKKNNEKYNIYVGINERSEKGTTQKDVLSLRTIVVDIDPIRKPINDEEKKIDLGSQPTTQGELDKAIELAYKLTDGISGLGKTAIQMSGNGSQIWIAIPEIEINDENRTQMNEKLHNFMVNLAGAYDNENATIDPSVGELARIIKVAGTLSIKGKNTEERPHRVSRWLRYELQEINEARELLLGMNAAEKATTNGDVMLPKPVRDEIEKMFPTMIAQGNRHYRFAELFGYLNAQGYTRDMMLQAMCWVNKLKCSPAKDIEQVELEFNQFVNCFGVNAENLKATEKGAEEYRKFIEKKNGVVLEIPKRLVSVDGRGDVVVSKLVYTELGLSEKRMVSKKKGQVDVESVFTDPIINGRIEFVSKVFFEFVGDETAKWHIRFNGKDIVGSFDNIVDTLYSYGTTFVTKDKLKSALAFLISSTSIEEKKVFPAVGIYHDKNENKFVLIDKDDEVKPNTDSQSDFMKFYLFMKKEKKGEYKDVLEASADFISSMPECNKKAALLARGFSCIAPISFALKKTPINVFPYLYLVGGKGSSKTQIMTTCSTYMYGEAEPLSGESVESSFRLGMEFCATTFPRGVDEAHDIFQKNLSIFKSGATNTMATKRGNKDKTRDKYNAFCTMIFTSNVMPIAPEEDAQGSVMDRVLMIECDKGQDFKKELYQKAMKNLGASSFLLGQEVCRRLVLINPDDLVNELMRLSAIIQTKNESIGLRRAYCLAEIAYGMKIYFDMLRDAGIEREFVIKSDEAICTMVYEKIHKPIEGDEFQNLCNFVEWAHVAASNNLQEGEKCGIFASTDSEVVERNGKLVAGQILLITSNSLQKYKQTNGLLVRPYGKLSELAKDMEQVGYKPSHSAHRDWKGIVRKAIKINIEDFYITYNNFQKD
jgi:hypothetical protein